MDNNKPIDNVFFAAIDLGSTFSGYTYTIRSESKETTPIESSAWNSSSGGLITCKTPTTILLDKSFDFLAFGYEAEDKYAELQKFEQDKDYCHYFPCFRMQLKGKANVAKDVKLSDVSGFEIPALHIFAHAIRYLKGCLIKHVQDKGLYNGKDKITWVLSYPAEFNDEGREFLSNAAEQAGMDSTDLVLVGEPEAALLFCKEQQSEREQNVMFKPGVEIFLVDAGGGSVDMSIQRIQESKETEMVRTDSRENFRATEIDANFIKAVTDIVGEDFITYYQEKWPQDYIEVLRAFENQKGKLNIKDPPRIIRIKCPSSLLKERITYEKENANYTTQTSQSSTVCSLEKDKIHVDLRNFKNFFEPIFTGIVNQMKEFLLRKRKALKDNIIFIVGGISACFPLREKVQRAFPSYRVITPQKSENAVLHGALLYGYKFNRSQKQFESLKRKVKRLSEEVNQLRNEVRRLGDERCSAEKMKPPFHVDSKQLNEKSLLDMNIFSENDWNVGSDECQVTSTHAETETNEENDTPKKHKQVPESKDTTEKATNGSLKTSDENQQPKETIDDVPVTQNRVPSQQQLAKVCHLISTDWVHLGVELGLERVAIRVDNSGNIKTAILDMLIAWRNKFRDKATIAALQQVAKRNEHVDMEKFEECFKD